MVEKIVLPKTWFRILTIILVQAFDFFVSVFNNTYASRIENFEYLFEYADSMNKSNGGIRLRIHRSFRQRYFFHETDALLKNINGFLSALLLGKV